MDFYMSLVPFQFLPSVAGDRIQSFTLIKSFYQSFREFLYFIILFHVFPNFIEIIMSDERNWLERDKKLFKRGILFQSNFPFDITFAQEIISNLFEFIQIAATCYPEDHSFQQKINSILTSMEKNPDNATETSIDKKDKMDIFEKEVAEKESQNQKKIK